MGLQLYMSLVIAIEYGTTPICGCVAISKGRIIIDDTNGGSECECMYMHVLVFQINFLFPVLYSSTFACGRAVHFHYSIIILTEYSPIF